MLGEPVELLHKEKESQFDIAIIKSDHIHGDIANQK